MSKEEDWQPGDLALCVNAGRIKKGTYIGIGEGLRSGAIYAVTRCGLLDHSGDQTLYLKEIDHSDGHGRFASRFRKIHPHTPDEEDEETIRLLKGEPVHTMENDTGWRPVGFPAVGVVWFFDEDGRRSSDDDIGGWIDEY